MTMSYLSQSGKFKTFFSKNSFRILLFSFLYPFPFAIFLICLYIGSIIGCALTYKIVLFILRDSFMLNQTISSIKQYYFQLILDLTPYYTSKRNFKIILRIVEAFPKPKLVEGCSTNQTFWGPSSVCRASTRSPLPVGDRRYSRIAS